MVTWVSALSRTRRAIGSAFGKIFNRVEPIDDLTTEQLEELLLKADVSPALVMKLSADFRTAYRGLRVSRKEKLRETLLAWLGPATPFEWRAGDPPQVILVVGVNGSGKTTTCAKLAWRVREEGLEPLLGAADTYRAAGADQLELWAARLGVDVVAGRTGADAAAVAYDGVSAALARRKDVFIVDTAGRMHTRQPLMQELGKIRVAVSKRHPAAPQEVWIVLDATLGQNTLAQARAFHQLVPLTGVVITKLDGSARAGFIFSIHKDLGLPIRFIGLGEQAEDLVPFDPAGFVEALLTEENEAENQSAKPHDGS